MSKRRQSPALVCPHRYLQIDRIFTDHNGMVQQVLKCESCGTRVHNTITWATDTTLAASTWTSNSTNCLPNPRHLFATVFWESKSDHGSVRWDSDSSPLSVLLDYLKANQRLITRMAIETSFTPPTDYGRAFTGRTTYSTSANAIV